MGAVKKNWEFFPGEKKPPWPPHQTIPVLKERSERGWRFSFPQGSTWRRQGWQAAPGEGSSWYKKDFFFRVRAAIHGKNLPRGEGWSLSGRFSRGDWTGCGINSSWLPFSGKVGPHLSFKVTSSLGCWFYELHSLLEGISHLLLMMERVQGESSLQRETQIISSWSLLVVI